LFNGGDTFTTGGSIHVYARNFVLGSYGSGKATIKYNGPKNFTAIVWLGGQGGGENVVENLIFDSIYTGPVSDGVAQGVGGSGTGDAVINCNFLNIDTGVNLNGLPTGWLIQANNAPLRTGMK